MDHALDSLLAQANDKGHEQAIYYQNRTIIRTEYHHNSMEKECLDFVFVAHKMSHIEI